MNKNDEGILDPDRHETCYRTRDNRRIIGRFQKREIEVSNQFGLQRLIVNRPNHVCLPASKAVQPNLPGAVPTTQSRTGDTRIFSPLLYRLS